MPSSACFLVKIAILRHKCAKWGKSLSPATTFSPSIAACVRVFPPSVHVRRLRFPSARSTPTGSGAVILSHGHRVRFAPMLCCGGPCPNPNATWGALCSCIFAARHMIFFCLSKKKWTEKTGEGAWCHTTARLCIRQAASLCTNHRLLHGGPCLNSCCLLWERGVMRAQASVPFINMWYCGFHSTVHGV